MYNFSFTNECKPCMCWDHPVPRSKPHANNQLREREENPEKLKLLGRAITPALNPVAKFCFPLVFRCLENFPTQILLIIKTWLWKWQFSLKQYEAIPVQNLEVILSDIYIWNYLRWWFEISDRWHTCQFYVSYQLCWWEKQYPFSCNQCMLLFSVNTNMVFNSTIIIAWFLTITTIIYTMITNFFFIFCSQWVGILKSTPLFEKAWISNTHPT